MIINACKTTMIFCRPNCPPGRRTKPENRVDFESFQAAKDAGFRACEVCKPEAGEYGAWVAKSAVAATSIRATNSFLRRSEERGDIADRKVRSAVRGR